MAIEPFLGGILAGGEGDKAGFKAGQKVTAIEKESSQPAPEWIFIPTLGVLALVVFAQRRRIAAGAPS